MSNTYIKLDTANKLVKKRWVVERCGKNSVYATLKIDIKNSFVKTNIIHIIKK
jgi:hypothetical protein